MLSWQISIDERVAKLPPLGQLLFTWMIAHADNCGLLRAEPAAVRATILPHHPKVTDKDVCGWLVQMHNLRLIQLYISGGGRFCRLEGWGKHQRMDRAVKSELPQPDTAWQPVVVSGCQWSPEVEGEREVEREREEEGVEPCSPPPSAFPPVIELPTNRTGEHLAVSEEAVSRWRADFPAVDVPQELRHMRAWLEANPDRRKTHRGMPAFVVRWLTKEQDRYRAGSAERRLRGGGMTPEEILAMGDKFREEESHV